MAEKKFQRKLTAIFRADVAGYSLLMRDDEEQPCARSPPTARLSPNWSSNSEAGWWTRSIKRSAWKRNFSLSRKYLRDGTSKAIISTLITEVL